MTRLIALLFALATAVLPAGAQQASDVAAPEGESGVAARQVVRSKTWMVTAAHPLAAEAGAEILRAGGSAVDAAVAVQLVLGLVEPQSSGLGGGAFLVYWDAQEGRLTTFDGRETAPLAASPTLFQDARGEPLAFLDAVVGGRSVGAPGTPRLLETIHRRYGDLPWGRLFLRAIQLAEDGFTVSPRLATLVAADAERLKRFPAARGYFFDADGNAVTEGSTLRNPDYGQTLRLLAEKGADGFYSGPVAEDIVRTVREAEGNPGVLAQADLANYAVREREAVCGLYRGLGVCGMGPPSSGGIAVAQILGLVEPYDLAALGPTAPESWRIIGDASRLAFADRERFLADSDFVPVPVKGLVDRDYLAQRSILLKAKTALGEVAPGNPKWSHASLYADDPPLEMPATSHFSIVDAQGNVVSMTTTIESGFGSRLMVRGFLLNNELTDFSFRSHVDGVPVANAVAPGKRPRSSMSPTIVMKDGRPYMALGSPGGSQIIGYVAKTLIAHIDWGFDIQRAISMPHVINRFGPMELEKDTVAEELVQGIEALGFESRPVSLPSGLHGIVIGPDGLEGGADPRREGVVIGE